MSLRSFALGALALLLVASGCKKGNNEGQAQNKDENRKVLLVGGGTEPQDLDPQIVTGIPENRLVIALFEGLVTSDPQTCEPVPGVAESWQISEDKLAYTFRLRVDAKWSNGDLITAHDFVRSFQRAVTPALANEYAYMFYYIDGMEDFHRGNNPDFGKTGVKAIDDHTLEIRVRRPTPFFLRALTHHAFLPVHIPTIEKFNGMQRRGTDWTKPGNFVGNGAFVLKEWRQSQRITLVRSETYWDRGTVKLDEMQFFPIESTDTEERMFRTGQLHMTYEVPRSKIPVYRTEKSDHIRFDSLDGVYFYRFNVSRPPLDNPKVRKALALAIDRESITRDVLGGGEIPAYSIVPPKNAGYEGTAKLTGDIAEAQRLLAEAGFPGGKGMRPLELLYNNLAKHRAVAEAAQQMWRVNLGVEVVLRNEEWRVYLDSQDNGNFDLQRAGWVADYIDPHVFLDLWQTGGGNNDSMWGSAEYDRLLRASLDTKNDVERYEVYRQMEKILLDELPILPVFFYTQPRLVSPKVKGYYVTPLDNYPWKHVDLAP